jgi:hypothetical protein
MTSRNGVLPGHRDTSDPRYSNGCPQVKGS